MTSKEEKELISAANFYNWKFYPSKDHPITGLAMPEFWLSPDENDEEVYYELPSIEKIKNV